MRRRVERREARHEVLVAEFERGAAGETFRLEVTPREGEPLQATLETFPEGEPFARLVRS